MTGEQKPPHDMWAALGTLAILCGTAITIVWLIVR